MSHSLLPRSCCVCPNKESETNGVVYFRLPDEPMLRVKWINAVPESYFFIPSENTYFCSDHFNPNLIPMSLGSSDTTEYPNLNDFIPSNFVKSTSSISVNIEPIIGSTLADISTVAASSSPFNRTGNNYISSGSLLTSSTQQCSETPSSYISRPLLTTSRKPYKPRNRRKVIPSKPISRFVFPRSKPEVAPGFKPPFRKIKPAISYTPIHPKTSISESQQIATPSSFSLKVPPSNAPVTTGYVTTSLRSITTTMLSKTIPSSCQSNVQPFKTVSYVVTPSATTTSSSPISSIPLASSLPHSTTFEGRGCSDVTCLDPDSPILVETADPLQLEDKYSSKFETHGTDLAISDPESPSVMDIDKSEQVSKKQLQSCCACDERNMERIKYHRFPSHCLTRTKWVKALDIIDFNLEMLRCLTVCSRHFSIDDYNESGELKERAVPSNFDKDELSKMTRRKLTKFRELKDHMNLLDVSLPVDIHDSVEEMMDIKVVLNRLDTKDFQSSLLVTTRKQEKIGQSEDTDSQSDNLFKKEIHDTSNLKIEVTPEIKTEDPSIDNSVNSAGIENIDLPFSIKTENNEDISISVSSLSNEPIDPRYILPQDAEFSTDSKVDLPLNLDHTHEFATDDSLSVGVEKNPSSPKILQNSKVNSLMDHSPSSSNSKLADGTSSIIKTHPNECTNLDQSHISNSSNTSSVTINGSMPIQVILNGQLCTLAYPKNKINSVLQNSSTNIPPNLNSSTYPANIILNGETSPVRNVINQVNQTQICKVSETTIVQKKSPRLIASQNSKDKIKILPNNSFNSLANQSNEQKHIQNNLNSIENLRVQIRHTQNIQNNSLNIGSQNRNLLGPTKKSKRLNKIQKNNFVGLTKIIQDNSPNKAKQNRNLLGPTKKIKILSKASQSNNLLGLAKNIQDTNLNNPIQNVNLVGQTNKNIQNSSPNNTSLNNINNSGLSQSFQNNHLITIPNQNIPSKQTPIIHNNNLNIAVNSIPVENNNLNAVAVSQVNQIPMGNNHLNMNARANEPHFLQNNIMFDQSSYSNSMISTIPISAKPTDSVKILPAIQRGSSNMNLYPTNSIDSGIFAQNCLISQSASHNSNVSTNHGISIQNSCVNIPVNSNQNSGLEIPIQSRSVPIVRSCTSTESVQTSSKLNCSSSCNDSLKYNEETQNLKTEIKFDAENNPVNSISEGIEMKNSNVINNNDKIKNSNNQDIVPNEPKTGFYLSNKQISSCDKIVFPIDDETYVFEKRVQIRHLVKPSRKARNYRLKNLSRINLELRKKVQRFQRQCIVEKLANKRLRKKLSKSEDGAIKIEPKFKFEDCNFSSVDIFGEHETVASAIYNKCISKIRNTTKTRWPIQSNVLNFASLLFIYSPDAYNLVRNAFYGALPNINNINEYINSVVNKGIEKEVLLDELETLKYSGFKRGLPSDWLLENYSFKIHKNTETIEMRNSKARKLLNKTNDKPTESSSSFPNKFRSERNISVNSNRNDYVTEPTFSDVIDDDSPSSDVQLVCTESRSISPSTVKKDSNQPYQMRQDGYSETVLNFDKNNCTVAAITNDALILNPSKSQLPKSSDHPTTAFSCPLTRQQKTSAKYGDGKVTSKKRKRRRL